ncbi:MAG TPA: energy transducer TonB [Kofleriaceae bacterium]|jgi:protein TonB
MAIKDDDDKTTPFIRDEESEKKPEAKAVVTPAPAAKAVVTPVTNAGTRPSIFDDYQAGKKRNIPAWAVPLITIIVGAEAVAIGAGYVKSVWDIERLEKPKNSFDLALAPPPPPPPPPPKGGAKPQDVITPKRIHVKDIVQPVKLDKPQVKEVEEKGDVNGEEGGVEGGQVGGVIGGDINGVQGPPPPPPPPPPPAPPQNVPPTALEQSRIAGEKMIVPDDVTKTEIGRSGKDKIVASYKLCITTGGEVANVNQLKSSGFPAYDGKIINTIRSTWKYSPFMVNGKATPVCTAVTFIYSQK